MSFQFETDHRDYLRKELKKRIERRPLYSMRAFARDLGLSASSLGDYLKENIRLSPGRIGQIARKIGLSEEQRQHWVDLVDLKFAKSEECRSIARLRVKSRLQAQNHSISLDEFKLISEWHHFAYLELVEMNSTKYSDLKLAAGSLGIPVKTLKVAVDRLLSLGFLRVNAFGFYDVDPSTRVGDQVPSEAVRQYHSQILKKSTAALDTQSMERRFNSSTMIALTRKDVEKVITQLRSTAIGILDPYANPENKDRDSLYCLNINFFDLLDEKGKSV